MSMSAWKNVAATTFGVAGIAATIATQPVQAASLNYTTTISLFSNSLSGVPLSSGVFNFTKTDVASQLVDYTLNSADFNLSPIIATPLGLQTSYTRSSLSTSPTAQTLVSLLPALIPAQYTKYSGLLTSFFTPNAPVTYRGNGDFPPADSSYSFTAQTIPANISGVSPNILQALRVVFAGGGRVTVSSSQATPVPLPELPTVIEVPTVSTPTAAVPEPTTMAGFALASTGLAIVRRKRQPKKAA